MQKFRTKLTPTYGARARAVLLEEDQCLSRRCAVLPPNAEGPVRSRRSRHRRRRRCQSVSHLRRSGHARLAVAAPASATPRRATRAFLHETILSASEWRSSTEAGSHECWSGDRFERLLRSALLTRVRRARGGSGRRACRRTVAASVRRGGSSPWRSAAVPTSARRERLLPRGGVAVVVAPTTTIGARLSGMGAVRPSAATGHGGARHATEPDLLALEKAERRAQRAG